MGVHDFPGGCPRLPPGDLDLLTLNTYQNIPIVTAAETMRRIEAQR